MAAAEVPSWALSKEDQKLELEDHLRVFLTTSGGALTPHQRFFLSQTIGFVLRGLFGLARACMANVYDDADRFDHYAMDKDVIARATQLNLLRALRYLESAPVRQYPIFC